MGSLAAHALSSAEALRMVEQAVGESGPEAVQYALGYAVGDPFIFAQSLEDFAVLAARQEQWERAAMLLGAAEGACAAMGWTPPAVPQEYERVVQGARAAMGEAAFAAACAAGRALSLAEAIQFALGARDA